MVKSGRKGYDVLSSATDGQNGLFAQDAVRLLQKQGFCVIDDGGRYEAKLEEVSAGVASLKDKLATTPTEILDGLLGKDGSVKYAKLDSLERPEILEQIDEQLGTYAGLIMEQIEVTLGFELASRTSGLVMESVSSMGGAPKAASFTAASEVDDWLQWLEWHRLMILFIAGPGKATLELKPFDDDAEEHSVKVEPGMFIILRCDAMSHTLKPKSSSCYTIGTFILESNFDGPIARVKPPFPHTPAAAALEKLLIDFLRRAKETAVDEQAVQEQLGSRELQRQTNRLFIRGDQIAARGMACRFPGCGPPELFYTPLVAGVDVIQDMIPERWDHQAYYCPDPRFVLHEKKTYAKHCSFVDGLNFFDQKFFGISPAESITMDPHQRQILENGYAAWNRAGYTKKSMMRLWGGVFMGSGGFEWSYVPVDTSGPGGTSENLAINANRLSFQLGLMGPSFSIDLEGAASMVAVVQCADACQMGKQQQQAGIAMGADLALVPNSMMLFSYARWNSVRGRCSTFDESADGHVRGEGVAGIVMDNLMTQVDGEMVISQDDNVLGVIVSARSGACGRTASYGAPHGGAEQELLARTIRGAELSPLDVDAVECNGLGAILHDAVEFTSTSKTYRGTTTQEMLGLGAVKTNHGHSMRSAGIASCFKVIGNIMMGLQSPILHLDNLNQHINLEDDTATLMITECIPNRLTSSFVGVSAKGYNGVLAHVIFHGHDKVHKVSTEKVNPSEEICYWPAGGGMMKAELRPNRAYTIVGSWNHWEPEAMDQIGRGIYSKMVTLSAAGFERFQIWMDGNKAKTLHPNSSAGFKDGMVHGPSPESETFGSSWQIDGRCKMVPVWKSEEDEITSDDQMAPSGGWPIRMFKATTNDQADPGTVFEVRLEVNGKYRTVTWEKVMEETAEGELVLKKAPVPPASYSVMGTFTNWSLEDMMEDSNTPGLYYMDATLKHLGAEFQILANTDIRSALYPSGDGLTTEGPDELGIGQNFFIDGKAGKTFRINLQREVRDDSPYFNVWWESTGGEARAGDPNRGFYVIGDWDQFAKPIPLTFKSHPPRYVFSRPYPDVGTESFQLLLGGERRFKVYPTMADATLYDLHRIAGPNWSGDGYCWTIGKDERDKVLMGEDYEVSVFVDQRRKATRVSWSKVSTEEE